MKAKLSHPPFDYQVERRVGVTGREVGAVTWAAQNWKLHSAIDLMSMQGRQGKSLSISSVSPQEIRHWPP